MKPFITLIIGLLLSTVSCYAFTTDPIYSYGSDDVIHQIDELPIVRKIGGGTKFLITYENESEWTMDMKGAFDYACKIWEEQLPSLPPLKITARIANIRVSDGDAPLTSVQTNIAEIVNPRDMLTSYLSTRLKYTVFTEFLRGTPSYDENLVTDSLFMERSDIIITINKSQLKNISFGIDTECADQYDAITLFLRDIAKGLGISTAYHTNAKFNNALFKPDRLPTPYEYLIEDKIFFDDPNDAYNDATQGSIQLNVMGYPALSLYAPNPWQQGVSLNTFIPDENSQISKLLSYNFGKGSVLRNIYDSDLIYFLEYGLKWNYLLATGEDSPNIGSSGTTNEIIPLDGVIKRSSSMSPYINYGLGEIVKMPAMKNEGTNYIGQKGYYIGEELNKYHYLYDPNNETPTFEYGVKVGILKTDGSWDIVYKGGALSLMSDIYVKDFQFHEPAENYARTCDGYLRMRVVKQKYDYGEAISCTYYALDYYPQKVEMGSPIIYNGGNTSKNIIKEELNMDDYTRTIIIPIRNIEGIDRIEASQLDEGNSYPYYYDIQDF